MMRQISGVLIDLDGVIYNDDTPVPGSADAVNWLIRQNYPFRFLSNTTMKSRTTLQKKLANMDIRVPEEYIFTAVYGASKYLRSLGNPRYHLFLTDDAQTEFEGLGTDELDVDFVVAGDLGESVTFHRLNEAFIRLHRGAGLLALQKNRYWMSNRGITLDAGAFVSLLEFASDKTAKVIGKPNPDFFNLALTDLKMQSADVLMIGDDIESDIDGAASCGLNTCLVKTGKFRESDLVNRTNYPDQVIDSIAMLPALLKNGAART